MNYKRKLITVLLSTVILTSYLSIATYANPLTEEYTYIKDHIIESYISRLECCELSESQLIMEIRSGKSPLLQYNDYYMLDAKQIYDNIKQILDAGYLIPFINELQSLGLIPQSYVNLNKFSNIVYPNYEFESTKLYYEYTEKANQQSFFNMNYPCVFYIQTDGAEIKSDHKNTSLTAYKKNKNNPIEVIGDTADGYYKLSDGNYIAGCDVSLISSQE